MSISEVTVYTDGASRGNPGPAAIAFVVQVDGQTIAESGTTIGATTNNAAEYTALLHALEFIQNLSATVVHVRSDSELMVRQMRGEYRVKHPDLLPLYQKACNLVDKYDRVTFTHVPRAENSEADRLCNEALDGQPTLLPKLDSTPKPPRPGRKRGTAIVELLDQVRTSWLQSAGAEPSLEEVANRLESIVKSPGEKRESGAARPRRARRRTT